MRVIRPARLSPTEFRRALAAAAGLLILGIVAGIAAAVNLVGSLPVTAVLAVVAAIGLGVGSAWLVRVVRPDRTRQLGNALAACLGPAFDDAYSLVVAPRLPVRDAGRLDGVLVGPAGVRVITARSWEGRYRVRGKVWDFDAGRRGWIRCRTNPSYEAVALADGVNRWATEVGLGELPIRAVVAFPLAHSRLVLEEPADEIVTADNAPWWANAIGRVQRLDPSDAGRVVEAVLNATERQAGESGAMARGPRPSERSR